MKIHFPHFSESLERTRILNEGRAKDFCRICQPEALCLSLTSFDKHVTEHWQDSNLSDHVQRTSTFCQQLISKLNHNLQATYIHGSLPCTHDKDADDIDSYVEVYRFIDMSTLSGTFADSPSDQYDYNQLLGTARQEELNSTSEGMNPQIIDGILSTFMHYYQGIDEPVTNPVIVPLNISLSFIDALEKRLPVLMEETGDYAFSIRRPSEAPVCTVCHKQ